jgi:hypothetical protein
MNISDEALANLVDLKISKLSYMGLKTIKYTLEKSSSIKLGYKEGVLLILFYGSTKTPVTLSINTDEDYSHLIGRTISTDLLGDIILPVYSTKDLLKLEVIKSTNDIGNLANALDILEYEILSDDDLSVFKFNQVLSHNLNTVELELYICYFKGTMIGTLEGFNEIYYFNPIRRYYEVEVKYYIESRIVAKDLENNIDSDIFGILSSSFRNPLHELFKKVK